MHPVLFHLFGKPVFAYPLFVALAFFASLLYGYIEARRIHESVDKLLDLGVLMFVAGIAGARILFVLLNFDLFRQDPLAAFKIWNGGFVWYGGMVLTISSAYVYVRYYRLRVKVWADLLAPTAMTALMVGRIGCFLNGCCYGKISPHLPWGIIYPPDHPALGLLNTRVHPAPLYESLATLLIFIFLVILSRSKKWSKKWTGQVFWLMVLLYSLARFFLEFFRGDPRGGIAWLHLSSSQIISIPIFLLALFIILRKEYQLYRSIPRLAEPGLSESQGSGLAN